MTNPETLMCRSHLCTTQQELNLRSLSYNSELDTEGQNLIVQVEARLVLVQQLSKVHVSCKLIRIGSTGPKTRNELTILCNEIIIAETDQKVLSLPLPTLT